MYLRTLRPPSVPALPPLRRRRRFPWARILLLIAIVAAAGYLFVPRYFNLAADGLVDGDLIPVAPLFTARIENRLVQCDQTVHQGQPLAVVANFLMEGQYSQDYQKAQENLRSQQVTQSEDLTQARVDEAAAQERYISAEADARKLEVVKDAYQRTYAQGAIGKVAYDTAAADWRAAQDQADALRAVWTKAQDRVSNVSSENAGLVAGYANEVALLDNLRNQVHSQSLTAPVSGRVVDCTAQPLAIVDAGSPVYKIFAPERAYILAFFSPDTATKVHLGDTANLSISGIEGPVSGKVVAIYPSLAKLPDQLTKYFWQHEQWSEYRPVKIAISSARPGLREQLTYDTQVKVRIPQRSLPWQADQREVGMP